MDIKNRRKQYIVDKKFQLKFIFKFCIIVIFVSVAVGLLIFYFTKGSTTVAIENTKVTVKETQDFILPVILTTVLSVGFFSALVVFFSTLFATHRIAGPIYRLSREVEKLKQGDLTRTFKIRSYDEFQELAENLSEMSLALRENYAALKRKTEDLKTFQDKEALLNKMKDLERLLERFEVG